MVTPCNSKFKQQAYSDRKPRIGKQSIDNFSFKHVNTFGVHGDGTDLPEKKGWAYVSFAISLTGPNVSQPWILLYLFCYKEMHGINENTMQMSLMQT